MTAFHRGIILPSKITQRRDKEGKNLDANLDIDLACFFHAPQMMICKVINLSAHFSQGITLLVHEELKVLYQFLKMLIY